MGIVILFSDRFSINLANAAFRPQICIFSFFKRDRESQNSGYTPDSWKLFSVNTGLYFRQKVMISLLVDNWSPCGGLPVVEPRSVEVVYAFCFRSFRSNQLYSVSLCNSTSSFQCTDMPNEEYYS